MIHTNGVKCGKSRERYWFGCGPDRNEIVADCKQECLVH